MYYTSLQFLHQIKCPTGRSLEPTSENKNQEMKPSSFDSDLQDYRFNQYCQVPSFNFFKKMKKSIKIHQKHISKYTTIPLFGIKTSPWIQFHSILFYQFYCLEWKIQDSLAKWILPNGGYMKPMNFWTSF